MNLQPALKKVIQSFEPYYTVKTEGVDSPFVAEAEFHSHTEKYVLVRAAKIADIDSHEYVFFAEEPLLTEEKALELDSRAWEAGLSRIKPYSGHRNSDVSLIIIADKIEEKVFRQIKRIRHSKSYYLSLWGWSNFRLMAYEVSTGRAVSNRLGTDLKKLVRSYKDQ
ncbi:MAG: hypothetical protein K6G00_11850 [Treponema sp.]|nr:hypothetical protein [Treponema sp.]